MKKTKQLGEWLGDFGKKYTDRNSLSWRELNKLYKVNYGRTRTELNNEFLGKMDRSIKILEVGSNIGNQLLCLQKIGFKNLFGIEPQGYAVEFSKKITSDINIIKGDAFDIPFKDGYFDMVFTSGVLIHINPKDIRNALKEVYRCSSKLIWGLEYFSEKYEDILYRGHKGLLWKTDFVKLYLNLFDRLKLVKEKRLKYLNNSNIDTMFLLEKK